MRPELEPRTSAFTLIFVQVIIFMFLFISLLYGVSELTLFAIIIHTVGIVSYLWSRASVNQVDCKITLNRKKLFPGGRLKIDIRAINSKLLPALFKINLFAPGGIAGSDTDQWISEEISLLSYQQSSFTREFYPNERGVYHLGPPLLRVGDPFGFFLRQKEVQNRSEVIVYPRIINIRPITISKREFFGISGAQSPVEDPIFVFGTRDYQPGTPSRRIHWKASARHNRLQQKLCEPAEQEKLLILLDVDQFENEQTVDYFERTLEVIAALALQMDRRGIAVGFATNGKIPGGRSNITPIARTPQQLEFILESLARIRVNNIGPLTDLLSSLYQIPSGVSSICFACRRSSQLRATSAFMKNRNIPVRFVLAQKTNEFQTSNGLQEDIIYLDDILAPESRKR